MKPHQKAYVIRELLLNNPRAILDKLNLKVVKESKKQLPKGHGFYHFNKNGKLTDSEIETVFTFTALNKANAIKKYNKHKNQHSL